MRKLRTRGNTSIWLFNNTNWADPSTYQENSIRFEWIKRLPFSSFSYDAFMKISQELIDLTKRHQTQNLEIKIMSFRDLANYAKALSLNGGQDDVALNTALSSRKSYSLEEFSQEEYERGISPQLFIKTPIEKDYFMITLSPSPTQTIFPNFSIDGPSGVKLGSNQKRQLEFYGQKLNRELFTEIVKRYHKPGLNHSLNHAYADNFLDYFLCKIPV